MLIVQMVHGACSVIPTVSNSFFMESQRSVRIEKVDIIQLACNGFINEALRWTRMSLMSRLQSMASLTSFAILYTSFSLDL